jgi:hypothetical protein
MLQSSMTTSLVLDMHMQTSQQLAACSDGDVQLTTAVAMRPQLVGGISIAPGCASYRAVHLLDLRPRTIVIKFPVAILFLRSPASLSTGQES